MEQCNITLTIIGIVGAICSAIIGAFFGKWLSRNSAKEAADLAFDKSVELFNHQEFQRNCSDFIFAFDDALVRLQSKGQHANGVLSETMPAHKIAHDKFRRSIIDFCNSETISRFDETWKQYYNTEKHGNNPFAEYNSKTPGTNEGEQEAKELAINNINKILDFVNEL